MSNRSLIRIAILAAALSVFGVYVYQEHFAGPRTFGRALHEHWNNVPMGAIDTGGYETYEIKMPVCGNPIVGDCVIDGNTLWLDGTRIMIKGLHAPKTTGRCKAERILGQISAKRLSELLSTGPFHTAPEGMGLHARALSTVDVSSGDLRTIMIGEGLADGRLGSDTDWCMDIGGTDKAAVNKPEADAPWRERFNPDEKFPQTGFMSVYFAQQSLLPKVIRAHSDTIAMNYSWDDFHNIDATNFAGYWAAGLKFDRPTKKTISISQHGKTKIRINGNIVHESKNQMSEFIHEFPAGKHTFEVEYTNAWHTVGYSVTLQDDLSRITRPELPDFISQAELESPRLLYAGLYTSSNRDNSVKLDLPKSDKPLVLWLDSYEPVNWITPSQSHIALAIIASRSPGTTIRGGNIDRVVHVDKYLGIRSFDGNCKCTNGRVHCQNKTKLADAPALLAEATGLDLKAYEVTYKSGEMTFAPFNTDVQERLKRSQKEELALNRSCGS